MTKCNEKSDLALGEVKHIEHFLDVYIPIQIHTHVCESLKDVLPSGSQHKIEFHEMDKAKRLNNYVLEEEKHSDLREIAKKLFYQI